MNEINKVNNKSIKWNDSDGTINVFVIRCNDIYETNDRIRNNDWLAVIENKPNGFWRRHIFKCTADPKFRRSRIANLLPQVYWGNIRNHRGIFNREAICQDDCEVWVRRYSGADWYEERGLFGINIHNPAGAFNSSLGCVILNSDNDYINEFRPLLRRVQKRKIPVAVMQQTNFLKLIKQK